MSVPVFLSSNCFGPLHFFHTHLQRLSIHGYRGESKAFVLLVKQELVEIIGESDGRERPGSIKAGTIRVAPADSVRTDQGDDLLVIEAMESIISTSKRWFRKERHHTPYG